jgi:hypothetical protein
MTDRSTARATIFSAERSKPQSRLTVFNGVEIEIRQPVVSQILGTVGATDSDDEKRIRLVTMLIANSYIPGTNEKIFEPGDYPLLLEMPFTGDFALALNKLNEMTNVDVKAQEKN